MALTDAHRDFLSAHRLASLATIKRDGRRRDPRATFMVVGGTWEYLVVDGDATLGEVTTDPHDAAGDALVDLYRTLAGEHPDWAEFRTAMVAEQRLVLSVVATHAYGILPS